MGVWLWKRLRCWGKWSPQGQGWEKEKDRPSRGRSQGEGPPTVDSEVILRTPKSTAASALLCPGPPRPTAHMVLLCRASSPGPLPLGAF